MISGAPNSINFFNLLFLLITLLYKSFKSEVANLPPSRGTSGLRSGGKTGNLFKIIHSGLFPEFLKASTILSLFDSFTFFKGEDVDLNSCFNSTDKVSKSISSSIVLIVSAPIPTSRKKLSSISFL